MLRLYSFGDDGLKCGSSMVSLDIAHRKGEQVMCIKSQQFLALGLALPLLAMPVASATGAETVQRVWSPQKSQLNLSGLRPARLELLAAPNLSLSLATFKQDEWTAPVDFVPTGEAGKTYVVSGDVASRVAEDGLRSGALPYTDRKYKIADLPEEFQGLTLVQTRMGHKCIVDSRYSIVLSAPQPCYLFVAVDERAVEVYKESGAPCWIEEYSDTGLTIATDDPGMQQDEKRFTVFVREAPKGTIALGPSAAIVKTSMYFAFAAVAE
jgi:hypothetical protein